MRISARQFALLVPTSAFCTIAILTVLFGGPFAAAAGTGRPLLGGQRNPSSTGSASFGRETEVVADVARGAGGSSPGTGGFATRQSNKSSSGGGAIYGCRARAGTEACVAANNLSSGEAFRFQAAGSAGTVGELRFGTDLKQTVSQPPFQTNGTGLVRNLNADMLDGQHANDLAGIEVQVAAGGGASRATESGIAATRTAPGVYDVTFPKDVGIVHCYYQATVDAAVPALITATQGNASNTVEVHTFAPDGSPSSQPFFLRVRC